MKKLFFLSILLCFFLSMQAQTTSVNISAGGLSAALSSQTNVTNLIVTGTVDARDFLAIQKLNTTLVTLDLSGITKIEAYSGTGGSDIYNSVTTYPADQIPYKALYYLNGALTTVVLPTGGVIDSIGAQAFASCSKLTSINIPNGVSSIGDNAFLSTGLTSITLPNSVTTLGIGVFKSSPLAQVSLSNQLTSIPKSTFEGTKLSSVIIPELVTSIGNFAFKNVSTLTQITLPSGLLWLSGSMTFYGTAIKSLILPANTQIIGGTLGDGTFQNTAITSFAIPSNVTTIGNSTFKTSKLASLIFPSNNHVSSLGGFCLSNTKLTSLVIPENVTTICIGALSETTTLKTLELPASLTEIQSSAFNGCTALTSIKVHNAVPVDLSSFPDVFTGIDKSKCILYVPAGTTAAYQAASSWKDFTNIQELNTTVNITAGGLSAALSSQTNVTNLVVTGTVDASDFKTIQSLSSTLVTLDLSGVTKIAAYSGQGGSDPDNKVTVYPVDQIPYRALYQVGALTTVVLPTNASIASIGAEAFKNCRQLISVNIPNGVSSIGDAAFSNTGFNTFTLPDNVTTLGIGVFQNSSSLTQVTLPSNLTEIPASTFQNSALSSITIPVSVTSIGNLAFYGTKITTITLPSGLQWLGGYRTFYSCFNLTAINNIPAGMQIIDGDMLETFANTQITSFTIPSNVTTIDVSAFESAPLTSLTFPTNSLITSILDYSLSGAQLTSLVIPEKVTTLGEGVLYGASAMKSLELPTSLTAIAADAFHNCSGLTSIKVHNPKPVDLSKMSGVFDGIDKTNCILYVPAGTKADYQAADGWKDFTNIQEFGTTGIEKLQNTNASLSIAGNPVQGSEAILTFAQAGEGAVLRVCNLSGKTVLQYAVATGSTTANLSVVNLSKGVYLVSYTDNTGKRGLVKMIK